MDESTLASELFASPTRAFAVRLWDGTDLPAPHAGGTRGRVVLRQPRALEAFLPPAAEHRVAEAVVDGLVDLEGDAIGLIEAAARWEGPRLRPALAAWALPIALRRALRRRAPGSLEARLRGARHSERRDRDAIHHHYDVSDAFYRLFLDDALVYSCAYFPEGGETLEAAQRAKLDLVCRKLALAGRTAPARPASR